MIIVPNLKE